MMFDRWLRAFAFKVWQLGLTGAIRFALSYLLKRLTGRLTRTAQVGASIVAPPKRDVMHTFGMVIQDAPAPSEPESPKTGWINWVIPPFSIGSGGHMTIFRMISMLESHGFNNRIYIVGDNSFGSARDARNLIVEHFTPLQADVHLGGDSMAPAEYIFATSWNTAYWVQNFQACDHRLYFVQDFEPYFYAHSSEYAFAEATYRMNLVGITAGKWLAEKLRTEYGMMTADFGFSYDKSVHTPGTRKDHGPRRVFFYARHVTPRRGFELGLLALTLLHRRNPDIEFILAGWDTSEFHIPFPHLNAGVVAHDGLPDLYRECDAALVLSFTNLSLLPLEIMACGCPVVSNRGANAEWLLQNGHNALLCDATPQAIADTLERVLNDAGLRASLIESGIAYAAHTDWHDEGARVAGYLENLRRTGNLGP
ncbi:MAG: glycosyltransferase family 4 protein [Pseudomonadota bacterium]